MKLKYVLFFSLLVKCCYAFDFQEDTIPRINETTADNSETTADNSETTISYNSETTADNSETTTSYNSETTANTTTSTTEPNDQTTTTTVKPTFSSVEETGPTKETTKIEVVVTRSLYRIIDEALRQRLVNFESRIAALITQRDATRDKIADFEPTFDNNFFERAFIETDRYFLNFLIK